MKKKELRKLYREKRAALSEAEKTAYSNDIARQFMARYDVRNRHIHVFLPIKHLNEPDVMVLVHQLWAAGAQVYTAIVRPGNLRLSHVRIDAQTEYTSDEWGIPVPSGQPLDAGFKFDLVLVPLLCCDSKGQRVGYGKGYYDHFLAQQPQAQRIGISFFEPVARITDVEKHDVPLDALVIPQQIIQFAPREK